MEAIKSKRPREDGKNFSANPIHFRIMSLSRMDQRVQSLQLTCMIIGLAKERLGYFLVQG